MECQTFTIEKNWRSQNFHFLGKKSKKAQGIFSDTLILALLSSAVFRLQNSVSGFF